jgi:Tol biopolymer transport system component
MTFEDLCKMKRLGEFSLSNNDKYIVFTLSEVFLDENRSNSDLYLFNINSGDVKKLTETDKSESSPQWSNDDNYVYYISENVDPAQIYRINIKTSNTEKVTNFPLGVDSFYLSKDGKTLLFTSTVFVDCKGDIECSQNKFKGEENAKVKAQIIDKLLYRHWNKWYNGKYTHLFFYNINSNNYYDVSSSDLEVPPFSLGGERDFDISPDSTELAFVVNRDSDLSTSTNKDIILSQANSQSQFTLTLKNKGYDGYPRYSPDGKYIAYKSQYTPNYESDRFRLLLYDRINNKSYDLTTNFDNWVEEIVWSRDSKYLYFTVDENV